MLLCLVTNGILFGDFQAALRAIKPQPQLVKHAADNNHFLIAFVANDQLLPRQPQAVRLEVTIGAGRDLFVQDRRVAETREHFFAE